MSKYTRITGAIYNGRLVTNVLEVVNLMKNGFNVELLRQPGRDALFYIDGRNNDVVYKTDVVFSYMVDGIPRTALDVIKLARATGFSGNDTRRESRALMDHGYIVKVNENPTLKHRIPGFELVAPKRHVSL